MLDACLVQLLQQEVDWRSLPCDDPEEHFCSVLIICRLRYALHQVLVYVPIIYVNLLQHLLNRAQDMSRR